MHYFIHPLTGLKKSNIMIALFIIALAVFGYICYVLLKPENF